MGQRSNNFEGTNKIGVDHHYRCGIIEFATVVWCGKYGHKLSIRLELVAIFYHLMSSADQIQTMSIEEIRDDVVSKRVRYASGKELDNKNNS